MCKMFSFSDMLQYTISMWGSSCLISFRIEGDVTHLSFDIQLFLSLSSVNRDGPVCLCMYYARKSPPSSLPMETAAQPPIEIVTASA